MTQTLLPVIIAYLSPQALSKSTHLCLWLLVSLEIKIFKPFMRNKKAQVALTNPWYVSSNGGGGFELTFLQKWTMFFHRSLASLSSTFLSCSMSSLSWRDPRLEKKFQALKKLVRAVFYVSCVTRRA